MKYIIYTLLAFIILVPAVYGAGKIITEIVLPEGKTVNIYSKALDKAKVRIIRFEDGGTTCYVAYAEQLGNAGFTSIDCK